jgi:hypothetical protein
MVHNEKVTVPPSMKTPPPRSPTVAVLPVMVHDEKLTVPLLMDTPPPLAAVLPVMVHDEKVTVPPPM